MGFTTLSQIKTLQGTLELLTGLHIGSGSAEMHIGGSDNPVIRHPISKEPYIPGSSIKGKVRSLLEWRAGVAAVNGGKPMSYEKLDAAPNREEAKQILKLFGLSGGDDSGDKQAQEIGPSRLSFWDCRLQKDWVDEVKGKNLLLTETKMENTIDRIRGVAEHPRNTERVPAGAKFDFRLSLKVLDNESDLEGLLYIGLKLLEMDGLGGSGSRGYGKIEFKELKLDELSVKLDKIQPFAR